MGSIDPLPRSLVSITSYLTRFGWLFSSPELIQEECRELLESLAKFGKEILPMVQDNRTQVFLTLLSTLKHQCLLQQGQQVELCGILPGKAVVRYAGRILVINIDLLRTTVTLA